VDEAMQWDQDEKTLQWGQGEPLMQQVLIPK